MTRRVFDGSQQAANAPSPHFEAITPNDGTNITPPPKALYVGTSGNIVIHNEDGTAVTFASVPIGVLPVRAFRVLATGTTASNIVGLW